ncbi:adenylate/guanylate cyclase domain-containing protein [Nocardioides sp. W3-2-3]|nr:adenylate/guanylate cyclase domain-containing protein [Nocardioides convexus]
MAASDGTVTLFFSDIENSTPLNDRLGDSTWVKVLAAHDRVLRARIEKYRGQVVKTAGDGFMVAFRDAEAACRAALGIQRDLPRDPTLRRHGPIQVRIGIHTGQVVARDGDYFGRNVAMAARVADLARGGEVLVSDAVREALDDDAAVVLEEHDTVESQGPARRARGVGDPAQALDPGRGPPAVQEPPALDELHPARGGAVAVDPHELLAVQAAQAVGDRLEHRTRAGRHRDGLAALGVGQPQPSRVVGGDLGDLVAQRIRPDVRRRVGPRPSGHPRGRRQLGHAVQQAPRTTSRSARTSGRR